jgi:hypothetical protein
MCTITIKLLLPACAVALSFLSVEAWAAAGKVIYSYGQAQAVNPAGQSRPLVKDAEVQSGDTLQTQQGRAQVTFADGGFVALQPNTTFKIADYNYAGAEDGSEHSFLDLLKGSMRFVTGAIGHRNKQNYKIKTVVATIGIRGSGGLAILCVAGSCPGMKDGLYLTGNQEVLTLSNDNDAKDVHPGETFYVGCSNCDIEPTEEPPVTHLDVPPLKDFMASEQCANNNCVLDLVDLTSPAGLNSPVRIIGMVSNGTSSPLNPPEDGVVTALNGGTAGSPPNFLVFNNSFTGSNKFQAAFFNGTVADFFTFADGAFLFRWTNGTVTEFGSNGSVTGTEVLGPNNGFSFFVGNGPRDPLPNSGTAFYQFIGGTASTQDSGAFVGQGIVSGQVDVNFFGPANVDMFFTVNHNQMYNVFGKHIPLNTSNGTFSSFSGGSVSASSYGGGCSSSACPVDIVGSLEGHAVPSQGNVPESLSLTYRIHDNFAGPVPGPQNWIKGAGAFGRPCFNCD